MKKNKLYIILAILSAVFLLSFAAICNQCGTAAEEEDVIEEVMRIDGYEKLPEHTLSVEIPPTVTPAYILQEEKVKQNLVSLGFDEVISLPFVSENIKQNIERLRRLFRGGDLRL